MSTLLERYESRGGKYACELLRVDGGWRVRELTNGDERGASWLPDASRGGTETEETARAKLAKYLTWQPSGMRRTFPQP